MHMPCIYSFVEYICLGVWLFSVLQLTSDNGGDLVPADPDAVLDLTDKSCVDRIVHLQYLQLVACDMHRVCHLS